LAVLHKKGSLKKEDELKKEMGKMEETRNQGCFRKRRRGEGRGAFPKKRKR